MALRDREADEDGDLDLERDLERRFGDSGDAEDTDLEFFAEDGAFLATSGLEDRDLEGEGDDRLLLWLSLLALEGGAGL